MRNYRLELRLRSEADGIRNYLRAGEFSRIPDKSIRAFLTECEADITFAGTGYPQAWLQARQQILTEAYAEVQTYLNKFPAVRVDTTAKPSVYLQQIRSLLASVQYVAKRKDDGLDRLDFLKFEDGVDRVTTALTWHNDDPEILTAILEASQRLLVAYAGFLHTVYTRKELPRMEKFSGQPELDPCDIEAEKEFIARRVIEDTECLYPNNLRRAKELSKLRYDPYYLDFPPFIDSDDNLYWDMPDGYVDKNSAGLGVSSYKLFYPDTL